MKKKKLTMALALSLTLGLGTAVLSGANFKNSAYAAETTNIQNSVPNTSQRAGLRRITGMRGRDYVISIAKDKFNLSEDFINQKMAEGKTMQDILEEKGISHEEFKKALLESKNKSIDNAVSKGTITKEEGDSYKKIIKKRSENSTPGEGFKQNNRENCNDSKNGNGRGFKRGLNN